MNLAQARVLPRDRVEYLLREAGLLLTFSYVLLLGGTFNGLVLYRLNVASLIVITAVGAAWLAWRWRRRRLSLDDGIGAGLIAVVAATALAAALSVDPRRSAGATMLLGVYVLAYCLVVDLLQAGWPAGLVVRGLLFAGSFVIAFGLFELVIWYSGWLVIGAWQSPLPPATLRVRAFLGHPNFVAALFSMLLPLALAAAVLARRRAARWIAAVWIIAAGMLVFFTSSRGGWLGTAVGIVVLAVLAGYEYRQSLDRAWQTLHRRPWVLGTLVLSAVVVLGVGAIVVYRQSQHPTHAGRDYIWEVAWAMVLRRPLTGNGPFTYGTEFIRTYSVPPDVLLAHAHNFFISTLAETGLVGAAAWIVLGAALVRAIWRQWRDTAGRERMQHAAVIAALAGIAVTSLFDTPQLFPALAVFCAILFALATAGPPSPEPRRQPSTSRGVPITSVLLTAGWLLVCGALAWSLQAYSGFSQGVLAANLGRWAEAGATLDAAARLDPGLAFYWLQAGYAHGRAGLRPDGTAADLAQVAAAVADYERGATLEPHLGTNWANLAMLHWAAGNEVDARSALESAVAAEPRETPFRLTLGRLYEARGELDLARAAFAQALAERPEWADTYFFRQTPLRQSVADDWRAQNGGSWSPGWPVLAAGWSYLEAGRFADARNEFQALSGLNTPEPYLGLGLAYLGEADYGAAERALRTAQFVPGVSGYVDVLIRFALGQLAAANGRPPDAIDYYEDGLARLAGTTSFGVGLLGNSDYGWYIFNRESIRPDLLPGIDAVPQTDAAVDAMLALAGLHEAADDAVSAQSWYCQAAQAAPDNSIAQARAPTGSCAGGN